MSESNAPVPLTQLNVYLTHTASLACRCCPLSTTAALPGTNGHAHFLPVETIFQVVREALPLGLRSVQLSGGEPFLYPDFDALLDRLESLELSVTIETTGAGITAERAKRLARLPQAKISIGLDGVEPLARDELRGGLHETPGALENTPSAPASAAASGAASSAASSAAASSSAASSAAAAAAAARLLSTAGLAPRIVCSLTRHNFSQVTAVIRLAELLGAESIDFVGSRPLRLAPGRPERMHTGGLPALLSTDLLSVEEIIALGRKIERSLSLDTRLRLSLDLPPAFRGLQPQARVEGQGRCDLLGTLSLLPSGEYALCGASSSAPGLIFGHSHLAEIWNSHPILLELRGGLPDRLEGVCGRCIMKSACLGYCPAENYLRTGAFWGPNWFCQTAERVGLFPAGRLIENIW